MRYFCFHDWKKWTRPISVYANYKQQWRECAKCGKVSVRSVFLKGAESDATIKEVISSLNEVK